MTRSLRLTPRRRRLLLVAIGVLVAGLLVVYEVSTLAPERLRAAVEASLAESTHADVEIASVRLVFGFPLRLEGSGLRLYDGALTVEQASARLDMLSLLLGRFRSTRLRLDGAHLQVERSPEGVWEPPIFHKSERDAEEPALAPLRAIEGATRFLLTRPLLADTLIVRRSRVSVVHGDPSRPGEQVRVVFEDVSGRLLHSRLFGDARLFLRVQLVGGGQKRGTLEWNGSRDEHGVMRVAMAADAVDLSTFTTYLRGARPDVSLAGTLDGAAEFVTAEPGVGRLDVDLTARDLETAAAGTATEPLRLPSLALRMRVDLDHERVVLSNARIDTGELDFGLDARIARPLRSSSQASLTVTLKDLAIQPETALKLAGWLPTAGRERFESVARRVRSGRLVQAELRGAAPLHLWGELFAGDLERLPAGFVLDLSVEDLAIAVDEANLLEGLTAELRFENDELEAHGAGGLLNGGPLPEFEVSFQGLSKVLAAPKHEREMTSSAQALVGLTPLFEFLRGDPDEEPPSGTPPTVLLHFEHLNHPALLWPLYDVQVQLVLQRAANGVRMDVVHCAWAGVLLDGSVDWTLRPNRRLAIHLVAGEPAPQPPPMPVEPPVLPAIDEEARERIPWALGGFRIGPTDSPRWSQRSGKGRFSAAGGALRLEDVEIELEPSGLLEGEVELDLTQTDRVPYDARLALRRGDLKTLIAQRGATSDVVRGTLDLRAKLAGNLVPGRRLLHDADGKVELSAEDGTIERSVPPVLALALASSSLNPFSGRDALRYKRASGDFELASGKLSTKGLEIEGPDIHLFASGTLDLSVSPPVVDAEVVLFLFRQVDRALELIPIVNVLLLGENQNLIAAYFQLEGSWQKPVAKAKPLRSLEEGPGDVLTKGIPRIVKFGLDAIGGLFRRGSGDGGEGDGKPPAPDATPAPPAEARGS